MSKPLKYFVILNVLCLLIGFALVLIKSRHAAVQADIMQQGLDLLKEIVERRHPR